MSRSQFEISADLQISAWEKQEQQMSNVEILKRGGLGLLRQDYLTKWRNYKWYAVVDKAIQENDYTLVVVPPTWGKTYGITLTLPLYRSCIDRGDRTLIISKSAGRASDFAQPAKNQWKTNKKLQDDFGGPFFDKTMPWSNESVKILGHNPDEHTATLTCRGLMGQIESLKPLCIILDDPIDRETAYSKTATQHFLDILDETIEQRIIPKHQNPNFKLIIITHRFCKDDGIETLMKDERFKNNTLIIPAIQGEGPDNATWIPGIEKGCSTCPEVYPDSGPGNIWDKKRKEKKYVWLGYYLATPAGRDECPFEFDWIDPAIPSNATKWVDTLPTHTDVWIDPAFKKKEKFDYTGIIAIGPHPTDEHGLILCGLQAMRIGSGYTEKYSAFFLGLDARLNPESIHIEINNANTAGDNLRSLGLQKVVDIHSSKSKAFRIGNLEFLFKRRPGQPLNVGQHRLYFHNSLRTTFNKSKESEGILKGWGMFMDEYNFWNEMGDSHDHLLDCVGSYYDLKYNQEIPFSGDGYYVA